MDDKKQNSRDEISDIVTYLEINGSQNVLESIMTK